MATADEIKEAYIDYVLTHNEEPKSVYIFAKQLNTTEQEFYNFFASFISIEKGIWSGLTTQALAELQQQEVWGKYTSREKVLAFFYAFVELLKTKRSFAIYSLKKYRGRLSSSEILDDVKTVFENFAETVISQGLASTELADRKFFSKRYKDALWVQFGIIVNFWVNDSSTGFEKTDEAIERGINVTFDLFQRSPLDNIFEYGKFITRNSRFRENMRF
jgi:hypothetical protein